MRAEWCSTPGRKKLSSGFVLFSLALLAAVAFLAGSLFYAGLGARKVYQDMVPLSGFEYNEEFLQEAGKIPGIRSVSPVLEIPVRLQIDGYEMDTVWLAVSLDELDMQVEQSEEVNIGSMPVLLLGKDSLAAMQDSNGHALSEKDQKKLLENYEDLEMRYCLDTSGETKQEVWRSCRVAGILRFPAGDIYMPYSQGVEFCRENGLGLPVKRAIFKICGKENRRRALQYFEMEEPF